MAHGFEGPHPDDVGMLQVIEEFHFPQEALEALTVGIAEVFEGNDTVEAHVSCLEYGSTRTPADLMDDLIALRRSLNQTYDESRLSDFMDKLFSEEESGPPESN